MTSDEKRRTVDRVILHCSATPPKWMEHETLAAKVDVIRRWHVEGRGWLDIGYHYLVDRDGSVHTGRDLDHDGDIIEEIGAHCYGQNAYTIGICLIGGLGANASDPPLKNFTYKQLNSAGQLILDLNSQLHKVLEVYGHNDFANKACPGFNVHKFWTEWTVEYATKLRAELFGIKTSS